MLALALALALAQPYGDDGVAAADGPIFSMPSLMGSYAAFEFAPASGLNMGTPCPMPNWLGYSEQLDNLTGWPNFNIGTGTAATRTANATASPLGTVTAEQFDFPAVASGANSSTARQVLAVAIPTTSTFSIWAKGVSGSGTVYLCDNGVPNCYPCNFTTSWGRCSAAMGAGNGVVYIAECSNGWGAGCPASTSAVSVYLWGAMVEPTTAAAPSPYVATNTAPGGYTPTGVHGEALTLTRSSTAYCTKGPTLTGISNGDFVLVPANQARVMPGDGPGLGLLVESSRTNSILQSQAIDNAAWTRGGAAGVVTADFAVAPDGTATADRYQFSNTNGDYLLQTFSVGGIAAAGSVYLKGNGSSGSINLCRGGAAPQCVACPYVAASWSRCVYAATLAASSNLFIGCDTATNGGACTQSGFDVLVWGLQGELGSYATSYIPTTTIAVTRAAESASFAVSLTTASDFSWAESVSTTGLGNTGCAGTAFGVATTGPQFFSCFITGLWAQLNTPGGAALSSINNGLPALPFNNSRHWLAWNRSASTVTASGNNQTPVVSSSVPAASSTAWTALTLSGDTIYKQLCGDQTFSRCR